MLVSDKVDFREKKITRDKGILHNDKMFNSIRWHNNPKSVCAKQESFKMFETNTDRTFQF